MSLELLPLEEADFPAMTSIAWEVFGDDLFKAMFPTGLTPELLSHSSQGDIKDWRSDPEQHKFMKVVDHSLPDNDPLGKMISTARWTIHAKDRTDSEIAEERRKKAEQPPPPGSNVPFLTEFYGNIEKYKDINVGNKAYVYLAFLGTRPVAHRRGAGAMQLRWGLELADRLHLPCYLEASVMGNPLYKRFGFEDTMAFPFDLRRWGVDYEEE